MMAINLKNAEKPEGWKVCSLPDFTHIEMGQSPPSTTYNHEEIGLPFFQGKAEFTDLYPQIDKYCSQPNKIAKAGATLLTVRAPVGPTNLAKVDCCIGRGLAGIHPLDDIESKFILLLMRSIEHDISNKGTGSTFTAINKTFLEELTFALPPINEQKRIVAKIEALFSELNKGMESLKTAREQLKIYRQAVLKHAFEGKLTADWREENKDKLELATSLRKRVLAKRQQEWEKGELEQYKNKEKLPKNEKWKSRYKKPVSFESDNLPDLPNDWCWVGLDELVSGKPRSMQSGPFGSNLKHSEFKKEGILVVGIDNVRNGTFSQGNQNRISPDKFKELKKYQARAGDLLVTVMASLGRTCVLPDDIEKAIITKHIYRITMEQDMLVPEFLNLLLQSETTSRKRMFANSLGQTRPGLNSSILRALPIPLCDLCEQKEVVSRLEGELSQINEIEIIIETELKRSEVLRQSILKKAFFGKLVAQDPNDEPASVLLERIKAEKEASTKPKKRNAA